MDPIAHTMVGATLARSGLENRSRFAAAALVIGANLPDVDGVTYFVGGDLGLYFRRGWTHGLPAVVLWPFLLALALVGLDRLLGSKRARFSALLPVSFLAVLTHPVLDWMNTYGVRFLMPLDGRWYYGDALFIVDPWLWLTLGGALFLSTRGKVLALAWVLPAVPATLLVWNGAAGLLPAKLLFATGLLVVTALRTVGISGRESWIPLLNRGALALAAAYIVAMVALSSFARREALAQAAAQGIDVEELMVGPKPITPFEKDVVLQTGEGYRYGTLTLLPSPRLELGEEVIPRLDDSPLVTRALAHPDVRGFANWARFPWAEVEERPDVVLVHLRDARYARGRATGFGSATVSLPPTRTY
jgi:inner membrane protein